MIDVAVVTMVMAVVTVVAMTMVAMVVMTVVLVAVMGGGRAGDSQCKSRSGSQHDDEAFHGSFPAR